MLDGKLIIAIKEDGTDLISTLITHKDMYPCLADVPLSDFDYLLCEMIKGNDVSTFDGIIDAGFKDYTDFVIDCICNTHPNIHVVKSNKDCFIRYGLLDVAIDYIRRFAIKSNTSY